MFVDYYKKKNNNDTCRHIRFKNKHLYIFIYLCIAEEIINTSHSSTNLIQIAKQHSPPHSALVADNLSLPHPRGVFDFAISIAVIHHLSTPARRVEAVKCVLELLRPRAVSSSGVGVGAGAGAGAGGGRALIYVWALEQKDSRRGWDEGHEQDVMVPWVLKQKKVREPKQKQKEKGRKRGGDDEIEGEGEEQKKKNDEEDGDQTFLRYYHLYRKGELEEDVEQAYSVWYILGMCRTRETIF